MTVFRCMRFPAGEARIRTPLGTVILFQDGRAEVDDPEQAQALREVPAVFGIVEEDVAGAGHHGAAPTTSPPKRRRTKKEGS